MQRSGGGLRTITLRPPPRAALRSRAPSRRLLSRSSVPPSATPRALIFMHGLGDIGDSWKGILEDVLPGWRLQTPTAPIRPITINGGARMPGWYDIAGLNRNAIEDRVGLDESRQRVEKIIESEIAAGVPSNNVFIGGFSQGGAMSLWTGLQYGKPLGGIVVLSGYLPLVAHFRPAAENFSTPIFIGHGTEDNVVAIDWGRSTLAALKTAGLKNIQMKEYDGMDHTVDDDEIKDLLAFLQNCLTTRGARI